LTKASVAKARFYLFTLRLVPAFPFFLVNLLLGLTGMKARTFYWVSQLGMLAGTVVYVNAGTQLAQARIALRHPLAGAARLFRAARHLPADRRRIVEVVRKKKVFAGWKKPASFDRNLSSSAAAAPGW
jgi:uncharacterized membrane protein YdjX (TVP38/TMEM64 family)